MIQSEESCIQLVFNNVLELNCGVCMAAFQCISSCVFVWKLLCAQLNCCNLPIGDGSFPNVIYAHFWSCHLCLWIMQICWIWMLCIFRCHHQNWVPYPGGLCMPLQFLVMLLASNNSLFSVKPEVVIFVVFLGFLQVSLRSLCVHDCLFYQTVPMCPSFWLKYPL